MRRLQKKQAEDFIGLLKQAHEAVREAVKENERNTAMDLLGQCQEGAIKLGELIEDTEGEQVKTISLLERYCELVYQIYQTVEQGHKLYAEQIFAELQEALIFVENSVRDDIKVRTEAVFLPYKASMWDSLESVWKAAEEDPNCDAYVIPIPYFDKNPDGSFKEVHYEGSEYPDYVKITDYDSYDFEKRRPDMIYIHNPYDECNYVTSVHPFFYSSNLKNFTEKLVYIPYFVLDEVEPENQETLEKMEHFCVVPGVLNADKVIVQSEAMRQAYINILIREVGESSRKIWEKKILGLGSPKIDKVLCTKKEDLEISEEWLKVIKKSDGNWKKIIFYNTSVTALLQHDEKMLEKMKEVFRFFEGNQEEIALLWRPHPLIKATIESMRPELWLSYQKIVEQYKKEGWGIYDDTADVDRAMIISDAYYCDYSSLVPLYQKLKKNVRLQNIDILNG